MLLKVVVIIDNHKLTEEQSRLIVDNLDFAKKVSQKIASKLPLSSVRLDRDDIEQIGIMGLIQAAQRFDADSHDTSISLTDNRFRVFAYKRIAGAIYDEYRKISKNRSSMGPIFMQSLQDDGISDKLEFLYAIEDLDIEEWIDIQDILSSLNDREASIILSIAAGVSNKEIAKMHGVTESRISQIVSNARRKILNADQTNNHNK